MPDFVKFTCHKCKAACNVPVSEHDKVYQFAGDQPYYYLVKCSNCGTKNQVYPPKGNP